MNSSNNLLFFPMPYPDELMYSVLARYHYYTPKQGFERKQRQLFGRVTVPSLKFVSFLQPLCERLDMAFKPEDFIEGHTLLPYYSHLVPRKNTDHARACVLGSSKNLMATLSRTRLNLKDREFRYCPLCAKEDLEKYGELFFRVQAHLDGIDVCPKHLVRLKSYPYDKSVSLRNRYLMLEPDKLDFEDIVFVNGPESSLAKMAGELARLPMGLYDGVEVRKGIINALAKNGLMVGTKFKKKEIYSLVKERQPETLKSNNLFIDSVYSYNWLGSYLNRGVLTHPLVPLLLIEAVYDNLDDFITDAVNGTVVPETLACHNPFCCNHDRNTASLVSVDSDYKGGIYRCSCGQVYHAFYDGVDKYSVVDYGQLYVEGLLELRKQGCSYSKIGRMLGHSHNVIIDQVSRFEKGYVSVDEITDKYLKEVRDYKKQCSEQESLNLTTRFNKQYLWVRKYRPESLSEFKTFHGNNKDGSQPKEYSEYSEQDKRYLGQARQVIENLFNRNPPVWVSKRLIVDSLDPIPSRGLLDRLVKTKEFINSHYETVNEYHLRLLLTEVEDLIKTDPNVQLSPANLSKRLGRDAATVRKHWEKIMDFVTKM